MCPIAPFPRRSAAALGFAAACAVVSIGMAPRTAVAGEIVYADGRRAEAGEPRQDAQGRWTALREGRRTVLHPGEVVLVIDDAGTETVTIPALAEGPDAPDAAASLAAIGDPAGGPWELAAERLAARPTKGVLDALVTLSAGPKKEVRRRAVGALVRLRTRESVVAATSAVLAEKDAALRRELSSALFSVQEIFRRSDTAEAVRKGLADRDAGVRVAFALLSPDDVTEAIAVLRKDGLGSSDHHTREDAAMELGSRGDAAGESVLAGMLARTKLPGVEDDPELMQRLLVEEQVKVCRVLGKLGTETGKAALKKAAASKFEAVRKAAAAALAAPPPPSGE